MNSEDERSAKEEFEKADLLAMTVLRVHLLMESKLDEIVELIFFHPEHVSAARFSFANKVNIARAQCFERDKSPEWGLIQIINGVRNEVAHKLDGDGLKKKLDSLRTIVPLAAPELKERTMSDAEMVLLTGAYGVSFLKRHIDFLADLKRVQHVILNEAKEERSN